MLVDHLLELALEERLLCGVRTESPALLLVTRRDCVSVHGRHVLPHEHADFVAPVEPALRLHLDVLADEVEAELLVLLDVALERVVRRGAQVSVRPVPLVERAVLEDELSVDRRTHHAVDHLFAQLAHSEVARELVHHPVAARHPDPEVVEERRIGAPELHVLRHVEADLAVRVALRFRHRLPAVESLKLDLLQLLRRLDRHAEPALAHMGDQLHARRRELVNGLQPHRLPDAAARRVPVPLRLVALLADGLRAVVRRVVHRDDQLVVAVLQVRRHVERERIVSAFVSALSLAVQIDVALPVDGVEVEPDVPPVVAPAFR